MSYDLDKYRDKREKVLGRKRRGISFGTMAVVISLVVVTGLGVAAVPRAVAFLQTWKLDDAIYKLEDRAALPEGVGVELRRQLPGVKGVEADETGGRLVVTFDRSRTDTEEIAAQLRRQDLDSVLLNKISRRQRLQNQQDAP